MSVTDKLGALGEPATRRGARTEGAAPGHRLPDLELGGNGQQPDPARPNSHRPLLVWGRRVISVGLLVAGVVAAYSRRGQIHQAVDKIGQPAWGWLIAACVAQASSMVAFARLQRWLLRCGGVRVRMRDMVEITLAGNALSTSLPGGAAWAAGWIWGQLRRRQVDRILAGWVVLVAGALASFALFLLAVVGAFLAGSNGPASPLRWVGLGLLGIGVILAMTTIAVIRSPRLAGWWARTANEAQDRKGIWHAAVRAVDGLARHVLVVNPGTWGWLEALGLAFYNWIADLLTLILVIKTVHASVPWQGIVVAYALTQIAASIPITPGGLAVVEASLAALLTAYGMPQGNAITVVLLYRLISFWALVPIGWASWAYLEAIGDRATVRRHHPWAEHRHRIQRGKPAPEPDAHLAPAGRRGPERLLRPAPCEGCPDELFPAGDTSEDPQTAASARHH
jgi:putative heme transporter